jgi:hypothetical protein
MARYGIRILVAATVVGTGCLAWQPARFVQRAQLTTEDRLKQPGFWPRKSAASAEDFEGVAGCASCHASIANSQRATPMALTAMLAKDSADLQAHAALQFSSGGYHYEIKIKAGESSYSVTDGTNTLKTTLVWAFGSGPVGQTYLFQRVNGEIFEARVSCFDALQGLDFTPMLVVNSAGDLESAAARFVGPEERIRCFSCHATGSTIAGRFDERPVALGVSCEACHGPGRRHADTMRMARMEGIEEVPEKGIYNPADLGPADAMDFCGACHGAMWDVVLTVPKGTKTVRFEPYRLQDSKCWGKDGNARLICTACHDPAQSA